MPIGFDVNGKDAETRRWGDGASTKIQMQISNSRGTDYHPGDFLLAFIGQLGYL
jgi:hypothetical protein